MFPILHKINSPTKYNYKEFNRYLFSPFRVVFLSFTGKEIIYLRRLNTKNTYLFARDCFLNVKSNRQTIQDMKNDDLKLIEADIHIFW